MEYIANDGRPMTAEEWKERFGAAPIVERVAEGTRFSVVKAQASPKDSPVSVIVYVEINGNPADHKRYILDWSWSDNRFEIPLKHEGGKTFAAPDISGGFYNPPDIGPFVCAVIDTEGEFPSDVVRGLGWLAGTNHVHFDITFDLVEGTEMPSTECPEEMLAELDKIVAAINAMRDMLA